MPKLKLARFRGIAAAATALAAGSLVLGTAPASANSVWDRVAKCESGGNWKINTGNGYYGGLQFSASTWRAFGGAKYASHAHKASKAQQIAVAQRTLAGQGPGAWPTCGRKAGLTRANGGATSAPLPAAGAAAPAPAKSTPAPKSTGGKKYTVKRGDTLSKIARAHGVAGGYKAIAKANGIANVNVIKVGQVLSIP